MNLIGFEVALTLVGAAAATAFLWCFWAASRVDKRTRAEWTILEALADEVENQSTPPVLELPSDFEHRR